MLDKDYIEEIRALDKKESKQALAEYADQFGIKLNKTKTFENMLLDLESGIAELASEPMPEVNEGLSISDLIQADDEAMGQAIFQDEAPVAAKLLIDTVDSPEVVITDIKAETVMDEPIINAPYIPEALIENVEPAETHVFELPKNFSPHLALIGKGPGYCTVPWWIYEWISKTPDWKENPTSFKYYSAHQTIFSLIYYINRNGSVLIRETRNSSFITLK